MKKSLVSIAILSLLVGSANLATFAFGQNAERGKISVNTTASAEVAPDVAEISFAVKTSDEKSMQKATLENKEVSDRLFSILKSMIDSSNGDYIKTADFNASPVYSYINSKKTFERYEVSNRVIVHTNSISKVGEMIDKAIAAGATNVDNLNFSISKYDNQCNELLSKATKKAQTRADILAKSVGASLDGISNLHASCNANNTNSPRLYMAKNMIADVAAESSAAGATSISNGVIKINANVNAMFFVK